MFCDSTNTIHENENEKPLTSAPKIPSYIM